MALEFKGAPDWLLQEYMNRKSTGQTIMDGIGSIANTYGQYKQQQQNNALQQKALANQEASQKTAQFGAIAPYIPEAQIPDTARQYGINIPQAQPAAQAPLGTPAEQEAQQSLPAEHSLESPIIQHWNSMQGATAAPGRPTSKFGRDQYAKDLQIQKTERDLATDPNAPVPVMSRDAAMRAGQVNPRVKIIDEPPPTSSQFVGMQAGKPVLLNPKTNQMTYGQLPGEGPLTANNQTEGQANAKLYADRMDAADKQLNDLSSQVDLTSAKSGFQGKAPNIMKSGNIQMFEQAKRNFLTAVLRRESGAVISPTEFAEGDKQYFPAFGDTPEVLKQKALNRQIARDGLRNAAGGASAGARPSGGDPLGIR